MAPKFTLISSDAQLVKSALGLKAYAQAAWEHSNGTTQLDYSATDTEAFERAEQALAAGNDAAFDNTRWLLFMPMRMPVTVMLSIDLMPSGPFWHLSVSRPNPQKQRADRAPEMFVKRVLRAFFGEAPVTEGPPEGPHPRVQHFRSPYRLN